MSPLPHLVARLRISTRLGLAFSVLLALMLLLAALAAGRLNSVAQQYEDMAARQSEIAKRVDGARHNAEIAVRKMLVLTGLARPARVQAYADIDAANARLDAALAGLSGRSIDGDHGSAAAAVLQTLQEYRAAYIDTADLIEADDPDAARTMIATRTELALNRLSAALDELTRRQLAYDTHQTAELRTMVQTDLQRFGALCGAALLVGGLLAAAVARGIARPLRRAEVVSLLLTRGEYHHRIGVIGGDEVGRVSSAINCLAQAVAEREHALLRMADTDRLTGLAQRTRFLAEARERLAAERERGARAVVVCVDVDRLKHVNALLGFDAGDSLLQGAAQRLSGLFEADDAVAARLGGGTFVLLVPLFGEADAAGIAQRVQAAVEHPMRWREHTVDLSVSLGMALFPTHADDPETLLRQAEQAMFEGKRLRRPQTLYCPSTEASRRSHLSLLSDLQTAIHDGQLRQFLQPKVAPLTGEVLGAEALVRWEHPQRGWLPPGEFIPFAESTGRIRHVTHWMLEHAARTLADWQARGWTLTLSVNLSTVDLQDAGLADRVAESLRRHGVPPQRLQLELTESGLMASGPDPVETLQRLRQLGVSLSIDDFGTGQSSLAYLQQLPVSELKIDRSFVDGVDGDARRQALLRSIIDMGHSLGLEVTAEGVETDAEMSVLTGARCDLVQGYLIARPMATQAFDAWHATRLSEAAAQTAVH